MLSSGEGKTRGICEGIVLQHRRRSRCLYARVVAVEGPRVSAVREHTVAGFPARIRKEDQCCVCDTSPVGGGYGVSGAPPRKCLIWPSTAASDNHCGGG